MSVSTHRGHLPSTTRHEQRCERSGRGRRLGAVALVAAGATLLGTGAFASWQASGNAATGTLQAATVGATVVGAAGGQLTTPVNNLLPGDWLYRYVDVTNTSSVSASFTGTVSATGLGSGLLLAVDSCSGSWSTSGSTCTGTVTNLVPAGTSLATAASVTHGTLASGAVQHVRYKVTVDPNAPTTLQGASGVMTFAVVSNLVGGLDRTTG